MVKKKRKLPAALVKYQFKKKTGAKKTMAKRRRAARIFGAVRRTYRRARTGARSGLASAGKYVVSGVVYAAGMAAAAFIPLGIDARLKRLVVLGIMWFMGGVFRNTAYIGLAFEVAMFAAPYIQQAVAGVGGGVTSNGAQSLSWN